MTGPVVIAGAGIGGLTAALALARVGRASFILEASETLEPVGAGIQLPPNALRVLNALGVTAHLWPRAVPAEAIRVFDAASGAETGRMPLDGVARRFGHPIWLVHRSDLQAALLDAVRAHPAMTLRLGTRVRGFRHAGQRVQIQAESRNGPETIYASGLVGADGLRSAVRGRLAPEAAPHFARRTAWRATIDAAEVEPRWREPLVNLWLGRRAHLVHYPVSGGARVNLVAIVEGGEEHPGWSVPGATADVLATLAGWAAPARALLAAAESFGRWSLYDLPPLPVWSEGAVTLLGDAAHTTLPFLAQGAAMAIEDAAVLAANVATHDSLPGAFRAYARERRGRAERLVRASARTGAIYHRGGPLARARDLAIRHAGTALLRRYDWIYRWTPPDLPLAHSPARPQGSPA